MKNVIIIAGGTGFVGSQLVRRLVNGDHECLILSRQPSTQAVLHKLESFGLDPKLLSQHLNKRKLWILPAADLASATSQDVSYWRRYFVREGINPKHVKAVVNLLGESVGSSEFIKKACLDAVKGLAAATVELKQSNPDTVFIHMGSVSITTQSWRI